MSAKYFDKQADISRRAAIVLNLISTDGTGAFFESTPGIENKPCKGSVATLWAEALFEYKQRTGHYPNANLLASAHAALERHVGLNKALMEDAGMRVSSSLGTNPIWGAFILPALLASTTARMCTFVDANHEQVDVIGLIPVTDSSSGDYSPSDRLDGTQLGRLINTRSFIELPAADQPDGKKTTFTFDITTVSGYPCKAIRPGTVALALDGISIPVDIDAQNSLLQASKFGLSGRLAGVQADIDYINGTVSLDFSRADPQLYSAGVTLGLMVDANDEDESFTIPKIALKEFSAPVCQTRYLVATEFSVQALYDLQREQSLSLSAILVDEMRRWLANEQDSRRLRTALFFNHHKATIDARRAAGEALELWIERLKRAVIEESDKLKAKNNNIGITGAYVGEKAGQLLRSLPAPEFIPDPDFNLGTGIRRAGLLFGLIEIFVVPEEGITVLANTPAKMTTTQALFFGSDGAGHSPLVAGDGIAPINIEHGTVPGLTNRTSLYATEINSPNPIGGVDYQVLVDFTNI